MRRSRKYVGVGGGLRVGRGAGLRGIILFSKGGRGPTRSFEFDKFEFSRGGPDAPPYRSEHVDGCSILKYLFIRTHLKTVYIHIQFLIHYNVNARI